MAVIGLGNRLLADEGAGMHAIELLRDKFKDGTINVDLVEAGLPGMALLHHFEDREKIIFIDAGNCGLKPGQYRRFTPGEAVSQKDNKGHSLHEFDLMSFLEFAKSRNLTGNVRVVIYCVQAKEMKMSEHLSPVVEKNLPVLVSDVYDEVKNGSYNGAGDGYA